MRYRVGMHANRWQPRPYHRRKVPHQNLEEFQAVRQALQDGRQLYVEVGRAPGAAARVLVARIEAPVTRKASKAFYNEKFLRADDIELVEVP